MIKVKGVFTFKDGRRVISATSVWEENISHTLKDILVCGDKKWKITAIERIFQGCFGIPEVRYHELALQPIDHDEMPKVGDNLLIYSE